MLAKWKHPGHRATFARFVLFSVGTLSMCWIFLKFPQPVASENFFIVPALALLSFMLAVFFGYRAFLFSDDWFRMKEFRASRWWGRHPRLFKVGSLVIWGSYAVVIACQLWRVFLK